jgi:hypothetical protein
MLTGFSAGGEITSFQKFQNQQWRRRLGSVLNQGNQTSMGVASQNGRLPLQASKMSRILTRFRGRLLDRHGAMIRQTKGFPHRTAIP